MASHKKQLAQARGQDLLNLMRVVDKPANTPPSGPKNVTPRGRPKKSAETVQKKKPNTTPKHAAVEDHDDAEQDDNPSQPKTSKGSLAKAPAKPNNNVKAIVSILESIREAGGLAEWLQEQGGDDNVDTQELKQLCSSILGPGTKRMGTPGVEETSEDCEVVDDLLVFRGPLFMTIMTPVDPILKATKSLSSKVIGMARLKGEVRPLMYALSGWTDCTKPQDKVLNSHIWTQHALRIGDFLDHQYSPHWTDTSLAVPPGTSFACHVEVKLILWVICKFVEEFLGETRSIKKQIARMFDLKEMNTPKAEIIMSKAPCTSCKRFRELIQKRTKVRFIYKVCINAGELVREKNAQGVEIYPKKVAETFDVPLRPQIVVEKPADMAIASTPVLRLGKKAAKALSKKSKAQDAEVTTSTTITRVQTKPTFSSMFQTPRKRGYCSEDDEDYALPRGRSQHESPCVNRSSKRKSLRARLTTAGESSHLDDWDVLEEDFNQVRRMESRYEPVSSFAKKMEAFKNH